MSTLLADSWSIPPPRAANPVTPVDQSSSGPLPALGRPGWWSWLDQPLQRIALREIADDPHLLKDLGLTREQALHEAARRFWR